jgi:hypothetical protein
MPSKRVGIMTRINVANRELRLFALLLRLGFVKVSTISVVKSIIGEEMSGIKRIYNPAENMIEQNFSKFGLLSASLPPR